MSEFEQGTGNPTPDGESLETGEQGNYTHKNDDNGFNDAIKGSLRPDNGDSDGLQKPDGLPEQFWDAETGEINIEALVKGYAEQEKRALGLRQKLSGGKNDTPQGPEFYEFTAPEGLEFTEADAPVLDLVKTAAHKYGLTNDQANGMVQDFFGGLAAIGLGETPPSPEEIAAQREAYTKEQWAKLGPNGEQVALAVKGFLYKLQSDGLISRDDYNFATNDPAGCGDWRMLNILNKIRTTMGYGDDIPGITGARMAGGELLSDQEIYDKFCRSDKWEQDRDHMAAFDRQLALRKAAGISGPLRAGLNSEI